MGNMLKNILGGFKTTLKDVRQQLEVARRRREELLSLPMAKEDLHGLLDEMVSRRAKEYEEALRGRVEHAGHIPLANITSPHLRGATVLLRNNATTSPLEMEGALAYLFADQIQKRLHEVVEQLHRGESDTSSTADRYAEISALDTKISELSEREAEMVRELEEEMSSMGAVTQPKTRQELRDEAGDTKSLKRKAGLD